MSKFNLTVPELEALIKCSISGYPCQNSNPEVIELVDKGLIGFLEDEIVRTYRPTNLGQAHVRQLCCLANPIKKSFWMDQNGKEIDYPFEDKITED